MYYRIFEQVDFKEFSVVWHNFNKHAKMENRCVLKKNKSANEDFEKTSYVYFIERYFGFHMINELYELYIGLKSDLGLSKYALEIIKKMVESLEEVNEPFIRLKLIQIMKKELYEIRYDIALYKCGEEEDIFTDFKNYFGKTLPLIYKNNYPDIENEIGIFDSMLNTLSLYYKSIINAKVLGDIGNICYGIWSQNVDKIINYYKEVKANKDFLSKAFFSDSLEYTYNSDIYTFNNKEFIFMTIRTKNNEVYSLVNTTNVIKLLNTIQSDFNFSFNTYRQLMLVTVESAKRCILNHLDKCNNNNSIYKFLCIAENEFFMILSETYPNLVTLEKEGYFINESFYNLLKRQISDIENIEPTLSESEWLEDHDKIDDIICIDGHNRLVSINRKTIIDLVQTWNFEKYKIIQYIFYSLLRYLFSKRRIKPEEYFIKLLFYKEEYVYKIKENTVKRMLLYNLGIEEASIKTKENIVYIVNQNELDSILFLLGTSKSANTKYTDEELDITNESAIYYPAYNRCLMKLRDLINAPFIIYNNDDEIKEQKKLFEDYIEGLFDIHDDDDT